MAEQLSLGLDPVEPKQPEPKQPEPAPVQHRTLTVRYQGKLYRMDDPPVRHPDHFDMVKLTKYTYRAAMVEPKVADPRRPQDGGWFWAHGDDITPETSSADLARNVR